MTPIIREYAVAPFQKIVVGNFVWIFNSRVYETGVNKGYPPEEEGICLYLAQGDTIAGVRLLSAERRTLNSGQWITPSPDVYWTPTPLLRWVSRPADGTFRVGISAGFDSNQYFVLQQRWRNQHIKSPGEWRDVPLEEEETP